MKKYLLPVLFLLFCLPTISKAEGLDASTVLMLHANNTAGKTVTANGNAQISTAQSKFGGASGYFDGSGDYLSVPASTDWDFGTGDFTVDLWFNQTSYADKWVFATFGSNQLIIDPVGSSRIWVTTGASHLDMTGLSVPTGWNHIAVVRSGTILTVYLNGNSIGSETNSGQIGENNSLYIGGIVSGTSWNGYVDEVRISKGIARWTSNFTPPTSAYTQDSSTVLLLHGDGTSGSTTFTDSGTGNGSITFTDGAPNTKTVTANGNAQISTAQSKFGGASGYFDGSGDYLTIPDNADFNFSTGDFTVDFWYYYDVDNPADGNIYTMFYKYSGGGQHPYFWIAYDALYASNGSSYVLTQALSSAARTWIHLAVVRGGGVLYVFKNGVLLNAGGTSYTASLSTANILSIGRYTGIANSDFKGYIDEFRISKGIARWTSNFTPPISEYSPVGFTADCTGGTITHVDTSTIHTFNTSGTLSCSGNQYAQVLVVAGGGGTGYDVGGGGGGGGVVYNSAKVITSSTITVTVGNGGASGQSNTVKGSNGENSVFGDITALGGGGGGSYSGNGVGLSGGSGGGGGDQSSTGGSATQGSSGGGTGYGYAGGSSASAWGGGGGGGAGGVGSNGITGQVVNGGPGYVSSISGASVEYGKGGKGNSDGGSIDSTPVNVGQGAMGTGSPNNSPYSGGSGIVIIKYLTPVAPPPTSECTGGTITHVGGKTIHTFTSGGTLACSSAGAVSVLVVAGGGGSGANGPGDGGGGGGGVIYNSSYSATGNISVTAGNGGARNAQGGNSVFGSLTAIGGGAGGEYLANAAGTGGSGGGGSGRGSSHPGASGTSGQGNSGGYGYVGTADGGGGGGGAGAAGSAGVSNTRGGDGGNGLAYSISGVSTYYGGGGGGGTDIASAGGAGGLGGGGRGYNNASGQSGGTANTGGGAGAGAGGNPVGGSGIVIVSYTTPSATAVNTHRRQTLSITSEE